MLLRALRDAFAEDENACKAAWAVHASKIYVIGLTAFLDPPCISETGRTLETIKVSYGRERLTLLSLILSC